MLMTFDADDKFVTCTPRHAGPQSSIRHYVEVKLKIVCKLKVIVHAIHHAVLCRRHEHGCLLHCAHRRAHQPQTLTALPSICKLLWIQCNWRQHADRAAFTSPCCLVWWEIGWRIRALQSSTVAFPQLQSYPHNHVIYDSCILRLASEDVDFRQHVPVTDLCVPGRSSRSR